VWKTYSRYPNDTKADKSQKVVAFQALYDFMRNAYAIDPDLARKDDVVVLPADHPQVPSEWLNGRLHGNPQMYLKDLFMASNSTRVLPGQLPLSWKAFADTRSLIRAGRLGQGGGVVLTYSNES
jgi:hypothetical protein